MRQNSAIPINVGQPPGEVDEATSGFWAWWDEIEENEALQNYSFYGLAVAYLALFLYALVQFNRLTPSSGDPAGSSNKWTIQNIFHLVIVVVTAIRSIEFCLEQVIKDNVIMVGVDQAPQGPAPAHGPPSEVTDTPVELSYSQMAKLRLIYDLPGLLFYNAYTTCVLFYAYVFHQLQGYNILQSFRPVYFAVNAIIYTTMIALLVALMNVPGETAGHILSILSSSLMAALALLLAGFYLLYGCRLYFLLKRFPIETRGRRRKMREVFQVTLVCTLCFLLRFAFILVSTIDEHDFALDVYYHPLLNLLYYTFCEIVPTVWVFVILRKTPARPPANNSSGGNMQSAGVSTL